MNGVQCENGHYYDADRFSACPMCQGASASMMRQAYEVQYGRPKDEIQMDDRFFNPNRGDFGGNMSSGSINGDFARIIVVVLVICSIIYKIYVFIDSFEVLNAYMDKTAWVLRSFFDLVSDLAIPVALIFIVRRIGKD